MGRNDIDDALQRLDKLEQGELWTVTAQVLKTTVTSSLLLSVVSSITTGLPRFFITIPHPPICLFTISRCCYLRYKDLFHCTFPSVIQGPLLLRSDFTLLRRHIGLPISFSFLFLSQKPMYDTIWMRSSLVLMYDMIWMRSSLVLMYDTIWMRSSLVLMYDMIWLRSRV